MTQTDPLVRVDEKLAAHLPLWTSTGTLPTSGPPPTLVGSTHADIQREMRSDSFAAYAGGDVDHSVAAHLYWK